MKVGVITYHRAQNFGAVLQSYALQKTIKKMGVECYLIDYRSEYFSAYYKRNLSFYLKNPKRLIATILFNGQVKDNRENFDKFIKNHMTTTNEVYTNNNDLKDLNKEFDYFFTGSDQVWNYLASGFDKSYFLDFVHNNKKKNAYSASFGIDSIPDNLKCEYKKLLDNFENISVREEQGAKIVNNLIYKKPLVVLDPTFLLEMDEWNNISTNKHKDEDYVLLYAISETRELLKIAKKIAKEKKIKVKYINDRLYKRNGMENLSKIEVDEWIELFNNANYIVTNSFHGIAFSINFKKEFYMQYLPKGAKVNSRLKNVLQLFDLEDRQLENSSELNLENKIDYLKVNEILEHEKNKSKIFIQNIFR